MVEEVEGVVAAHTVAQQVDRMLVLLVHLLHQILQLLEVFHIFICGGEDRHEGCRLETVTVQCDECSSLLLGANRQSYGALRTVSLRT